MKIDGVKFDRVVDIRTAGFKTVLSYLLGSVGSVSMDTLQYFVVWDRCNDDTYYCAEIGLNTSEGIVSFHYEVDKETGKIVYKNSYLDIPKLENIIRRTIYCADVAFKGCCDCVVYLNPNFTTTKRRFKLHTGIFINNDKVKIFNCDTCNSKCVFGMVVEWI